MKNTNTKIVHKIFAQDDKDAIGNTIALSNEQKEFLSFLDKGRAVVFSQGWDSSLQVQVVPETDTGSGDIISEEFIRNIAIDYYCEHYQLGIYPSLRYCENRPDADVFLQHLKHRRELILLVECYQRTFERYGVSEEFQKVILALESILSIEKQARYIRDMIYYSDKNEEKLNAICSLLIEVKNGKFDVVKYDEKLSYGRRK